MLRQRLRAPREPARVWMRRQWRSLTVLALACVGVILFDAWLATCGFDGCPTPQRDPRLPPGRGRQASSTGTTASSAASPSSAASTSRSTRSRCTCARRSSPPRTAASTSTTASTGAASSAPPPRTCATSACARASARSRCRSRATAFSRRCERGRTLRRKLIELRLARLIERELTKDQILELYLNVIYLGNGVYGVEAASRDLFGKSVDSSRSPKERCSPRCPRGRPRTRRATIRARARAPQSRARR